MLTLDRVREIALTYVPYRSVEMDVMESFTFGPAHEIAHLLLAAPYRVGMPGFGLDRRVRYATPAMEVEEVAAHIIHTWIVVATDVWSQHRSRRLVPDNVDDASLASILAAGQLVDQVRSGWRASRRSCKRTRPWLMPRARRLVATRGITRATVQVETGLIALCKRAVEDAAARRSRAA
jgi:hypothetical protein